MTFGDPATVLDVATSLVRDKVRIQAVLVRRCTARLLMLIVKTARDWSVCSTSVIYNGIQLRGLLGFVVHRVRSCPCVCNYVSLSATTQVISNLFLGCPH